MLKCAQSKYCKKQGNWITYGKYLWFMLRLGLTKEIDIALARVCALLVPF